MKDGHFQQQYDAEAQQRTAIESALTVPVGVVTVLGGAVYLLASAFHYEMAWPSFTFATLTAAAFLALCISACYLMRVLHGFEYSRIPTPTELWAHYGSLKDYAAAYGGDADADFAEFLNERLAQATERNAENNASKLSRLHNAKTWTFVSMVLLALAAPFGVWDTAIHREPCGLATTAGRLSDRGVIMTNATNSSGTPKPPPPQATRPNPPPKPQGPQNKTIREGTDPLRKR